jgi:hypothetical protein
VSGWVITFLVFGVQFCLLASALSFSGSLVAEH